MQTRDFSCQPEFRKPSKAVVPGRISFHVVNKTCVSEIFPNSLQFSWSLHVSPTAVSHILNLATKMPVSRSQSLPGRVIPGAPANTPSQLVTPTVIRHVARPSTTQLQKASRTTWKSVAKTAFHLSPHLLSLALLVIASIYVQATSTAQWKSSKQEALSNFLKTDVSTTLAVVQVCQVVLIALNTLTLGRALDALQWCLITVHRQMV